MPDDHELLGSASRVVHGIQQAGKVRGLQVAGSPDHEQRPSVLLDEPPNILHRLHRVLGPFEHVSPYSSLCGDELCKLHHQLHPCCPADPAADPKTSCHPSTVRAGWSTPPHKPPHEREPASRIPVP